jgi:hypothetical protein
MMAILITYVLVILLIVVARWRMFQKAGEPGWATLIPIYGTLVMLRIIGKPGWWLVMFLIPFVNLVYAIWAINLLSKSFGKDEGFTVGMLFLPFVFYPILGFGGAQYIGAQSREAISERDANSI